MSATNFILAASKLYIQKKSLGCRRYAVLLVMQMVQEENGLVVTIQREWDVLERPNDLIDLCSIKNALMFSTMVFQSFLVAGEPHHDHSIVLDSPLQSDPSCPTTPNSNGWTDGLIFYDPSYASNNNFQICISKHYWTYKHFGNFVKPGSQRHQITGTNANEYTMAVSKPGTFYVLALNPNSDDSALNLTFPETVCAV
ncbi:hypothetical protein AX17_004443 [Amanita inopinata Kibby_2008]|nr:hypothetical protein AX17_004443 [Amanita inopinata Kibby_2008]